ncbi:trehalase [Salinarchaeum sp. Harcht-Bsk1]|uniref:trehalase family glycosidase n=1 Tax=Salinarchaeum sp. Harcht-Bsk1 TaxID=1333523 RepID=UPI0003424015|nr:trehalase family glycosidase [Salinarchaeum sp. Harcht-Bsk1]AGN00075.1 trehalase [Salinarchaeum sp. Harcht-Bsk1]
MTFRGFDYSNYPQVSGELFRAVQQRGPFDDAKRFVDSVPRVQADLLHERYLALEEAGTLDVDAFVEEHFRVPEPIAANPQLQPDRTMEEHVEALWEPLTRTFNVDPDSGSTLVPLPEPHVVPGGRFREMYYWDSYFAMEGLAASDRLELVEGMIENVASLLDRFDFVPLGNRVYYDSRSQVPLFYRMLRILERERGPAAVEPYLDALQTEHAYWMDGSDLVGSVGDRRSHRRTVALPDGTVVNRYWDDRASPRPEAHWNDRELAKKVPTDDRPRLFRDLRAAAESGWDFSTRWMETGEDLTSIRTTELVPVDLNAVLFGMETALAEWLPRVDEHEAADRYASAANRRREAIERYCWSDDASLYVDYVWTEEQRSEQSTLAGAVPLFTGIPEQDRADAVAERLRELFLERGGLLTTLEESGEQWDAPNGWAPLQWMAIEGLRRYGHDDLAAEIADRWLAVNRTGFETTGQMAEKYDVESKSVSPDSGEYDLQYGFAWTNGVVAALTAREETA